MRPYLAVLLLCLVLAGCVTLPHPATCTRIGPVGSACLLPPQAWPQITAQQMVTIHRDDQEHVFLGRLSIDRKDLHLAAVSLSGMHLFTISWDGHNIGIKPERDRLDPKRFMAFLQIALVDPDQLRPHLHGLKLVVKHDPDGQTRELWEMGHLVARIHRSPGPLAQARLSIHIPPAHTRIRLDPLGEQQ